MLILLATACGDATESSRVTRAIESSGTCAFAPTDDNLVLRTWAFDGTIHSLGTVRDSQLGEIPSATFTVNRWYKGGADRTVTVQFRFPTGETHGIRSEVGQRLLVSGEPRHGGEPLDDPVAWGCGFTRVWTATESERWVSLFQ
jgi:hypothetical protein